MDSISSTHTPGAVRTVDMREHGLTASAAVRVSIVIGTPREPGPMRYEIGPIEYAVDDIGAFASWLESIGEQKAADTLIRTGDLDEWQWITARAKLEMAATVALIEAGRARGFDEEEA